MESINTQTRSPADGAQQPAIVEHFSIDGLFGYRSIGLNSSYAATIVIARNGAGKTTLLAALDAFLKGQFSRFINLEFSTINCKLRGLDLMLSISKDQIDNLSTAAGDPELIALAKVWDIEPLVLLESLEFDISSLTWIDINENHALYSIYTKIGYDVALLKTNLERLRAKVDGRAIHLAETRATIRSILSGYDIVYLPTYRRIELSLPTAEKRGERKKNILAQLGISRRGLYTADIQFGLGDIRDRLRALYSEMLFSANQGYGKISASIINDLISGAFRRPDSSQRVPPSKESLELFFSRIKDGERDYRRGPFPSLIVAPDLNRVFQGDVPEDAKPFLEYFLDQLNVVIQDTRGTEELVEAFIGSCNAYLSGEIDSKEISKEEFTAFDWKEIKFHKRNLQVSIESLLAKKEVPLESLSSGEKQMISLFARLYLYPGKKLILIDEPELSLSLAWQRRILPDILRSPSCEQLIAITHSPFIFDNELDSFAGTLKFEVMQQIPELFPDSMQGSDSDT